MNILDIPYTIYPLNFHFLHRFSVNHVKGVFQNSRAGLKICVSPKEFETSIYKLKWYWRPAFTMVRLQFYNSPSKVTIREERRSQSPISFDPPSNSKFWEQPFLSSLNSSFPFHHGDHCLLVVTTSNWSLTDDGDPGLHRNTFQ